MSESVGSQAALGQIGPSARWRPSASLDRLMTASPARLLSVVTLFYLAFATLFLFALGTNPFQVLRTMIDALPASFNLARTLLPGWLLAGLAVALVAIPGLRRRILGNWQDILLVAIYSSMFVLICGLVKTHLPILIPFWADAPLAWIDGFTSPRWALGWLDRFQVSTLVGLYMSTWVVPTLFFPVILAIADPDIRRRRLFTLLWLSCWVLLGNVVAGMFMSMGPIFLDQLTGVNAAPYADVFRMLARPDAAALVMEKTTLWNAYAHGDYVAGSGISAFPSVHVATAVVFALYFRALLQGLARRRPGSLVARSASVASIVVPVAMVLLYQALAVYLGWHYAIDGYASIVVMLLLHRWLSRLPSCGGAPAG